MLSNHHVDFVLTEVGMNKYNTFHVSYEEVFKFMTDLGHEVFDIYDQQQEFITSRPVLRRVNVMFISPTISN